MRAEFIQTAHVIAQLLELRIPSSLRGSKVTTDRCRAASVQFPISFSSAITKFACTRAEIILSCLSFETSLSLSRLISFPFLFPCLTFNRFARRCWTGFRRKERGKRKLLSLRLYHPICVRALRCRITPKFRRSNSLSRARARYISTIAGRSLKREECILLNLYIKGEI